MDQQIAWSSDYAALDGWRDILFDRGILVRLLSVDTAEFRGFSVLERHLAGIGISSKDAPPARIFSLFHEVAHLCLRLPGVSGDSIDIPDAASDHLAVVERYCNCFAVAFLLPDGDGKVAKALADLSASSLAPQMLRHYSRAFKVSKYVLARRMLDIGLLQPDMYWNTIDEWRNQEVSLPKGGHPDYMTAHVSQIGKRFAAFVLSAMDRGILNGHDAAGILAMRPDKLDAVRLHLA
jgi:Zn-dependent peptidase ImmA (M78 family)